jgi:hypothetical protein
MATGVCGKCGGTGLFSYTSIYGRQCFKCNGTGIGTPARKPRAPKARPIPATISIASKCAGDPTKLDPANTRALEYLGLTVEDLAHYADLWRSGVREIPNPRYSA